MCGVVSNSKMSLGFKFLPSSALLSIALLSAIPEIVVVREGGLQEETVILFSLMKSLPETHMFYMVHFKKNICVM